MADLVNLKDDGEAEFAITDRETGAEVSYDQANDIRYDEDEDEANKKLRYRCRKCGSENCAIVNHISGGSSWTGAWGTIDLECNDCKAYRTLVDL